MTTIIIIIIIMEFNSGTSTRWLYIHCFPGRIGIWRVGFCGGRKTGEPREKPSEQEREPTTNSTHM